jgi:glycosyltransferase involved in cell wall biosynthesis
MLQERLEYDVQDVGDNASLDLSIVCPFYNEAGILDSAVRSLLAKLSDLEVNWELIIVNDGSRDNSLAIAEAISKSEDRLRLISYSRNRGRGHALRSGIRQARGKIIVTTEIDLSWGEDIVDRLYEAIQSRPDSDIVIASPHLEGGGYKNVPWKRVFFSRFGNRIIRALMINAATMNTGMTRAYRRHVIRALPLEEDGKEFHLEVVLKAKALNYTISEIPSLLEWKEYKLANQRVERKSSSRINKLVVSHSLFSLFGNPVRYVWALSGMLMVASLAFLGAAVWRLLAGDVSVFMVIIGLVLALISLMLFAFGILSQQANMIQKEIWTLKQRLDGVSTDRRSRTSDDEA